MSYNTPAEFRTLSFSNSAFDGLSDTVVQSYLDVAASEIDAALRPHHTLPLASGSVPALIMEAERVIAGYRLFLFRGFKPSNTGDQTLTNRYDEIVGGGATPFENCLLGRLSKGLFLLPREADATPSKQEGAPRVFSGRAWNHRFVG